MTLSRGSVALVYGFLYGLAGAVLVGTATYLSIITSMQGSPLTGDSQVFLQCGLFLLQFGLIVAFGWLARRHTGMLHASVLCGAIASISYDVTYVVMTGAKQIHAFSNGTTASPAIYWTFDLAAGLQFAWEHLLPDNLYYLVLAALSGAILGALGGWIGKQRLQPQ